jgi:hypothetical protein
VNAENQESGITYQGGAAAELAEARGRLLRGLLALASVAIWIAYLLKTGNPHPRMLAAIVCAAYTLVALIKLSKRDLVYFPLAALLTGLSFWQKDVPGVLLGTVGALLGIGGMSGGVAFFLVTTFLSSFSC